MNINDINNKIQKGDSVSHEDLNLLWNYKQKSPNIFKVLVFYSGGLFYKSKVLKEGVVLKGERCLR